MKVTIEQYKKYKKPENCDYPFHIDGISYCWGYATKVDEGKEKEMDCEGCEFFTPPKGER